MCTLSQFFIVLPLLGCVDGSFNATLRSNETPLGEPLCLVVPVPPVYSRMCSMYCTTGYLRTTRQRATASEAARGRQNNGPHRGTARQKFARNPGKRLHCGSLCWSTSQHTSTSRPAGQNNGSAVCGSGIGVLSCGVYSIKVG